MTITSNPVLVYSFAEYCSMFALEEADLQRTILDYPAGVSSFNAQMYIRGQPHVVSADRYYDLSLMDMQKHVNFVVQDLSERIHLLMPQLNDNAAYEIEEFLNQSNAKAQKFLQDYSLGRQENRYQVAKLPKLPFAAAQFDLALCSNLMFRQPQFPPEFVAEELMRVAREVRIFPLHDAQGDFSSELGPVMLALQQKNYGLEVKAVSNTLFKKSNAMLRVWSKECIVT